jgi:hypothetical protein
LHLLYLHFVVHQVCDPDEAKFSSGRAHFWREQSLFKFQAYKSSLAQNWKVLWRSNSSYKDQKGWQIKGWLYPKFWKEQSKKHPSAKTCQTFSWNESLLSCSDWLAIRYCHYHGTLISYIYVYGAKKKVTTEATKKLFVHQGLRKVCRY